MSFKKTRGNREILLRLSTTEDTGAFQPSFLPSCHVGPELILSMSEYTVSRVSARAKDAATRQAIS